MTEYSCRIEVKRICKGGHSTYETHISADTIPAYLSPLAKLRNEAFILASNFSDEKKS